MKKTVLSLTLLLAFALLAISPVSAQDSTTLYGITNTGGAHGFGTLFKYNYSTDTYTVIVDMDSATTGSYPRSSLVQHSNGKMYGFCNSGGANDWGTIFEFDPVTETYTKKLELDSTNGRWPNAAFTEGTNGKLYALVYRGGSNDRGVLLEYDPNNTVSTKMSFTNSTAGFPRRNNLVHGGNGKLYGTVQSGGIGVRGVLVEYDYMTDTYTEKYEFGNSNARIPRASMVLADNGKLYGTLNSGGANDFGVIFEYVPGDTTITIMVDLDSANTGSYPTAGPMKASNGNLYIMMNSGGVNDVGVIVEYVPGATTATKKVDLSYVNDGSYPWNELTEVSPGLFYATLNGGGAGDYGTLIEYNLSSNIVTKKIDMDSTTTGAWPYGYMITYEEPDTMPDTSTVVWELHALNGVELYPNPVNDKLVLKLDDLQKEIYLVITDVKGQEVMSYYFEHRQLLEIDVSPLSPGVYFVNMQTDAYTGTRKFVKH